MARTKKNSLLSLPGEEQQGQLQLTSTDPNNPPQQGGFAFQKVKPKVGTDTKPVLFDQLMERSVIDDVNPTITQTEKEARGLQKISTLLKNNTGEQDIAKKVKKSAGDDAERDFKIGLSFGKGKKDKGFKDRTLVTGATEQEGGSEQSILADLQDAGRRQFNIEGARLAADAGNILREMNRGISQGYVSPTIQQTDIPSTRDRDLAAGKRANASHIAGAMRFMQERGVVTATPSMLAEAIVADQALTDQVANREMQRIAANAQSRDEAASKQSLFDAETFNRNVDKQAAENAASAASMQASADRVLNTLTDINRQRMELDKIEELLSQDQGLSLYLSSVYDKYGLNDPLGTNKSRGSSSVSQEQLDFLEAYKNYNK